MLFDPLFLHLPSAIWCTIALPPILEPVGDLSKGEPRLFGQGFLLVGGGVSVEFVGFFQRIA